MYVSKKEMKKENEGNKTKTFKLLYLGILAVVVLGVAAGFYLFNTGNAPDYYEYIEDSLGQEEIVRFHTMPGRFVAESHAYWDTLTREQILYDIDYLLFVLEENYPFFGTVYRQRGVDIHELGQHLRDTVEVYSYDLDLDTFWTLINHEFFAPIGLHGHLRVMDRDTYVLIYGGVSDIDESDFEPHDLHNISMFRSQSSRSLYGELNEQERRRAVNIRFDSPPSPGSVTPRVLDHDNGFNLCQGV